MIATSAAKSHANPSIRNEKLRPSCGSQSTSKRTIPPWAMAGWSAAMAAMTMPQTAAAIDAGSSRECVRSASATTTLPAKGMKTTRRRRCCCVIIPMPYFLPGPSQIALNDVYRHRWGCRNGSSHKRASHHAGNVSRRARLAQLDATAAFGPFLHISQHDPRF